jgi:hypothetical protein
MALKFKSLMWMAFLAGVEIAGASTTHYVSVAGKDANPGTAASPWRTIQHACTEVASGDTVLVETGVYQELVTIRRSMNLQNAPGAKPIIDGAGLAVPANDAALVLINNVGNVLIQGFEIRNFKTTNSNLVPSGILIEGSESGVTLRGNLIDHIENDGTDAANINGFGIAVYGNSAKGAITNLVIDQNTVTATKTGNSETVTLNGNVNGFRVTNNSVHDVNNIGIDCIGFEGTSPIKGQDQARNGYVGLNTVYNVTSLTNSAYGGSQSADGIYVDGGTAIVLERNTVHNADIGFEVTSEHGGHVASQCIVRNNLIYSCNVTGLSIGGYDSTRGGTLDCTFVNNTFYQNDTTNSGSGEFTIQFHTSGNVFKNNILCASSQGVIVSEDTGSGTPGLVCDHNVYFTPNVGNEQWTWGATTYTTFASFQKGSKGDAHSKYGNPEFVDTAKLNFELTTLSNALNAGVDLGTATVGTLDLAGAQRLIGATIDIGCYETSKPGP